MECYCDARNKPIRCKITKPQTASAISLWFWGLLAYPELYCDWPLHNQHSWNISGVHGFLSLTVKGSSTCKNNSKCSRGVLFLTTIRVEDIGSILSRLGWCCIKLHCGIVLETNFEELHNDILRSILYYETYGNRIVTLQKCYIKGLCVLLFQHNQNTKYFSA